MRKLSLLFLLVFAAQTFALGRELGPRGAAPTSYLVGNAYTAFAGDRFLTVWPENMQNLGVHVMGALSDADGRRITPVAFPVMPLNGILLQLVGTGDGYALFWHDRFQNTILTDIDLNGRVVRTNALAIPRNIQLHVGWNGEKFLATVRSPTTTGRPTVEGFFLARSGEVLQRGIPFDTDGYSFDIAGDGDGFAAITGSFDGSSAYRISRDGEVTSYLLDDEISFGVAISRGADGSLLAVWTKGLEMHASLISLEGDIQQRGAIATSAIPMRSLHVRPAGNAHLVTYLALSDPPDNGILTLIVNADGTVTPAPEPAVELAPRVQSWVTAASNDRATFAVYTPQGIYPHQVMSVAIVNDATATSPENLSITRSRQSQPILGSANGRVVAAWSDIQGAAAFVRTASLAPDASPVTDTIAAPAYLAGRELVWNGAEFLAVEARNNQLLATRLAADGTPLDAEPLVLATHTSDWHALHPSVAWADDRWVVAWEGHFAIYFSVIHNGVVTQPKELDLGGFGVSRPTLAFNGTTLLLVWDDTRSPECWFPPCIEGETRAYAARVTPAGELLDLKRLEIPVADDYSIATSGAEFFILGGTTATVIDASASRILASREIFNWTARGDVEWNGSSYAVALRYRGVQWHVSVTHFDGGLNVTGTPRGTPTLPPDTFVAPSIAAGIVGVQEGDSLNGTRAVAYRAADLPPLPPPPAAPLNVRATPTGDGRFEITWDESPGAELYRVTEFSPVGSIWSITDVPATQPRSVIQKWPNARVIAFNAGGASEPLPRRRSSRR